MKNLLGKGIKCLIVQSEFGSWKYVDVCKITGLRKTG
jgi:hypothetical protein